MHKDNRNVLAKMTVFSRVNKLCLTYKIFYDIIWTIKWRDYALATILDLWVGSGDGVAVIPLGDMLSAFNHLRVHKALERCLMP